VTSVATHLRCGGIFSNSIIINFLLILTDKNGPKFLGHPVYYSATVTVLVPGNTHDFTHASQLRDSLVVHVL